MPLDSARKDELKAHLTLAKKKELAFGLCLGKKPEGTVIVCHKSKKPEAMIRDARKMGETPKVTCGMMKVEGKELHLTCFADPLPNLAKRTRDMLKAAGMKYKVKVFDKDGGALESDGEDEDEDTGAETQGAGGPETTEDPVVAEWEEARDEMAARMKSAAELPGGEDLDKLWQMAQGRGDKDPRAGLMALEELDRRLVEAEENAKQAQSDQKKWEASVAKIEPLVKEVEAIKSPPAAKAAVVWKFANDKVNADVPDYAAGFKALSMLVKLIQEAKAGAAEMADAEVEEEATEGVEAGPGGGSGSTGKTAAPDGDGESGDTATKAPEPSAPEPVDEAEAVETTAEAPGAPTDPGADAGDKEKLDHADAQLKYIDELIKHYMAIISGSAETEPAAWTKAKSKVDAILKPMRADETKIDVKKINASLKVLGKLASEIMALSQQKEEWKKTLDIANVMLVPIKRHKRKAAAEIAPKIAALDAIVAKAVAKADKQDFKGAHKAIDGFGKKCDAVEKLADDFAHYSSVHGQRQGDVTTHTASMSGEKPVEKIQKAMKKLLARAEKLATKDKFADAVKKLDEIPPLVDQFRRMERTVRSYKWWENTLKNTFATIDARPADERKPFQKKIDAWKKQYSDGKVSKTKDHRKSLAKFQELGRIVYSKPPNVAAGTAAVPSFLEKEMDANKAYMAALKDFDVQHKAFEKHKGRAGIEEEFQAMDGDLTQAKAEAVANKFSTATAILERTRSDWPAYKTAADECEAYVTKRDDVAKLIAELKKKPAAADPLAQAEAMMAEAVKQSQNKEFKTAKATVEEAEKRANAAKAAADAKDDLDKLKDDGALGKIAVDIDKAIKVYDDMRANVAGKDTTGSFAGELTRADAEAQKARDEKTNTPPDYAEARKALDAGIAILEATLPKAMAAGPCATHLAEAKALTAGLVATDNANDNCIKPQLDKANKLISDAETLAKTPTFDFKGAEDKLVRARAIAEKATVDVTLWNQIKTDKAAIATAKTNISGVAGATALMGPTIKRLDDAVTAVDNKVAAEDFKAASKLAADAKTAAANTAKDLKSVKTIIKEYKKRYTDEIAKVTGADKDKWKSQLDELASRKKKYEDALAAGNYDAARKTVYTLGWSIDTAKRIKAEHAKYETARAAAEMKVRAVPLVDNDDIKAEAAALKKRYDEGVALSDDEKNLPAEKIMLALPADCDALIDKARKWSAYDTSLKAAQTKITEMEGHKQAAAILPMINALRGKLTGAVSLAGKGDYDGAKASLDTIPGEADKALATANEAGAVADEAADLGDEAPDEKLLKKAEALYAKLESDKDAAAAKDDLKIAREQLDTAGSKVATPKGAQEALKQAMEACTRAEVSISRQQMVNTAIAETRTELATLTSHAEKDYIKPETDAIDAELKSIEKDMASSGPDVVGNRIRTQNERCAAAKVLADKHAEYVALRDKPEVKPRLKVLEEHDHRYAIKPSIDTFRKKLDEAKQKVDGKDPEGAILRLQEGQTIAQAAWVLAEMRANNPPTPAEVAKLLEGPGGDDQLDAMIDQLEPDAQRKVIEVAFEARFGVKLETYTASDAKDKPTTQIVPGSGGVQDAKELKRFYDIMVKLPKEHVVDNDSMRTFTHRTDGSGSYYSGTEKNVVMREGDEALSGSYGFGRDFEVGGADPECEPANDEEVTYFSWNTLHEVGHAVDDKNGFMDKNGSGAAYGGWTMHMRDTHTIAKAVAPHFKYDETYIGQILSRNASPPVPPKPETEKCSDEEWDSRRVAFEAWAKLTETGNKPWTANATAEKLAIGGMVYQESYGNKWTSYQLAARKKGMTGYQFRAPAEWFAELYAAYHSGKLKPAHPAVSWLEKL
ncbi:hypothetical protein SAMN05444007_103302 [Cribrihabitans marinus]|uniref:Uncharacterized protein n=1 Tax=Cribrihabitans marinus TaxID=1227549 RepID=A0A1H6W148_9RHOB|nr:hypothetical protein [Cribrihabitans marinus]GGH25039.1 hypothetical protein GCM10010973_11930 [Cribrihabitans marinus]SEJ09024.1 hypothetical protein SAMN05444007_103302 [Cribrihabitans marinus]